MQLEQGIIVSVMSGFRPTLLMETKIRLNSGIESRGCQFVPRGDWRDPSREDLLKLAGSDSCAEPTLNEEMKSIEIFEIPNHLSEKWGQAADALASAAEYSSQKYKQFIQELVAFFAYKRVKIQDCRFDVVAARSPEQSALVEPGHHIGLGIAEGEDLKSPLLAINLGEEPTSMVYVNLALDRMRELNNSMGEIEGHPDYIAVRFMGKFPQYPVVKLILKPRQGVGFFPCMLVHGGYAEEKKEIDVVLRIGGRAKNLAAGFEATRAG